MPSKILILDFGSQYTQVIARRVRQLNVYSEIVRFDTPASVLKSLRPAGIILSGGPASVYGKGAPQPDKRIFEAGIPILGVCYGMQLFGKWLGGEVAASARREYGRGHLEVKRSSPLFKGLDGRIDIWNSHGDSLKKLPKGLRRSRPPITRPTPRSKTPSANSGACNFTRKSRTPRAAWRSFPTSSSASVAPSRRGP